MRASAQGSAGHAAKPALMQSPSPSGVCGSPVYLKLEHPQTTGSVRLRGATQAFLRLDVKEKACCVVSFSTGNHGRALSYAASKMGLRATICTSRLVPEHEAAQVRRLGADIRIARDSQDEAEAEAGRLMREKGLTLIPPLVNPDAVVGRGRAVLISRSLSLACRLLSCRVTEAVSPSASRPLSRTSDRRPRGVGVSMDRGAAMKVNLGAGRPTLAQRFPILADSLGRIGFDNRITFGTFRDLLDGIALLGAREIAAGIRYAYFELTEVLERWGAIGVAALLARKVSYAPGPIAVVLSRRNMEMRLHRRIAAGAFDSES